MKPNSDTAYWSEHLRRTLECYDDPLLRQVATKLLRPRSQWPVEELIERSLALPYVRSKQSRMAAPKSRALCLPDDFATGPPDAFIDSHEFCHLHPLPESSIHLTLPQDLRELAVQLGWAEPHLVSRLGSMPPTLVLVYAPRNMEELSTVFRLVRYSYEFARGM